MAICRHSLTKRTSIIAFLQGNGAPHHANVTNEFLKEQELAVMDYSSTSPDLIAIENVLRTSMMGFDSFTRLMMFKKR